MVDVGERVTMRPGDAGYPRRLDGVTDAPPLHVRGTLAERPHAIAVVGSRAAPRAVLDRAFELAHHAATRGHAVISGGALGVDAAAHRGALAGGGHTIVVLGSGLDVLYPDRNRALFAAIVAAGGALVSKFPHAAAPLPGHFVARNRIIAALADLIVVVGAERGSGSLHTARAAVELGRRLAAVPGTTGTDALIAAGAAVVETAVDLDLAVAGTPRRRALRALDATEAAVIAALDPTAARTADVVAAAAGLRLPLALGLLATLEVDGWVVPVAGGAYVRARG